MRRDSWARGSPSVLRSGRNGRTATIAAARSAPDSRILRVPATKARKAPAWDRLGSCSYWAHDLYESACRPSLDGAICSELRLGEQPLCRRAERQERRFRGVLGEWRRQRNGRPWRWRSRWHGRTWRRWWLERNRRRRRSWRSRRGRGRRRLQRGVHHRSYVLRWRLRECEQRSDELRQVRDSL
jgi:hypothetical protein